MNYEHNKSGFTNFSRVENDCPRCGEENDKCGVFEESGLVMCRTDMSDSVEPRVDANGWEYWPFASSISDEHSDIYEIFSASLSLSNEDETALISRGLIDKEIIENGYKTIPHRNGEDGLNQIINILNTKFSLKDIPGFYLKNDKRDVNARYKQMLIPVRNFSGKITQFVLRNNEIKGKKAAKYLMFSSDGKDEGQKIIPQIHLPLGNEKCTHEVRITEGILKADIATALGNIYCIGLHGLSSKGLIPAIEMLGVSKIRLCLDIDWQENTQVLNGLRRIYGIIANAGFEVVIEEWNAAAGKGIDDVLLAKGKTWELPAEDLEYLLECPKFNRSGWVYINKSSQFAKVDSAPIKLMDEKHFNNHFIKLKDEFSREAKASVKQTDSVTYIPKGELTILENDFFNLNLWRDTGIGPSNGEGDLSFFFDHLKYLFSDELQQEMMLDWLANVVQHRGKKFSYAMLLHGEEGTGKTWLIHCLSLILGKSNVGVVSNDSLHRDFNSMLEAKELLIVNEVMAGGRRDFMTKMKDYIDLNEITINKKGVPEYPMPFNANWFMTTNHDDALLLDDKDRRYLIVSSDASCGDENDAGARGAALFAWSGGGKEKYPVNAPNLGALHDFLLKRRVTYSPFAKAPETKAKAHMQDESLTVFEQFIKERLEGELWPFNNDLACVEHIKLFPSIDRRFEKISAHRWGKTLRKFGAVPYGCIMRKDGTVKAWRAVLIRMKAEGGKQRRIWMLRRHKMYSGLNGAAIEELYVSKKPSPLEPDHRHYGNDEPL